MSTETPKRQRPTVAALNELETLRDAENRARNVAERALATERAKVSDLEARLDVEERRWSDFDESAKALGRLVEPLSQYALDVRGGRWAEEYEPEVAEAVERLLIAVGARFGARLVAARFVSEARP